MLMAGRAVKGCIADPLAPQPLEDGNLGFELRQRLGDALALAGRPRGKELEPTGLRDDEP